MSKHTPGPWTAVQDGNEVDWYIVDEDESVIVFGLSEPDARLSAAAPDLLAALQRLHAYMLTIRNDRTQDHIIEDARAAIAKAEGTS